MSKGTRYIDGREYLLCGRYSSGEEARKAAKLARAEWMYVRTVKLNSLDFMIYVHGRI
jgi:hypothetical protein